nr:hypothetical protein [uncultured Campylobacter sp.]
MQLHPQGRGKSCKSVTSLHESVTDTHKSVMIAWSLMTGAASKTLEFKRG